MTSADSAGEDASTARVRRAAALKERIYVAFTVLAVVITLRAHGGHPSAGDALGTLGVTVAATICAVYLADLLSYMVIRTHLPSAAEHRHMVAGTLGAGAVAVAPAICLALALAGVYATTVGLLAAMLVTVATLVAVGLLAVRRLSVPRAQRIAVLAAASTLALVVVALELLSHR